MNTIKLIVAAGILASVSFVASQAPATEQNLNLEFANTCNEWPICRGIYSTEQNLNLEFANTCNEWPICRGIYSTEQNDTFQLSGARVAVISKTA